MFWKTKPLSGWLGQQAEKEARAFLEKENLSFVSQNFRCKQGEIDLIMTEQDTLVFVEVKYRSQQSHGFAKEYLTPSKRVKITKAIAQYLHEQKLNAATTAMRIDLVAIDGHHIEWLKNV